MKKLVLRIRKIPSYAVAGLQLLRLYFSADSPYKKQPLAGHMRGIDFYQPMAFYRALANAFFYYNFVHGVFPNICRPTGFNQKVFWFKFFGNIKVPESGNKLLTATFIPQEVQSAIRCPEIVWHSAQALLPANDEIDEGVYYLKANQGSGMNEKVYFPLSDEERSQLQDKCSKWLTNNYGILDGEWWYNAYRHEILLEKAVESKLNITWGFYVLNGEFGLITMVRKLKDGLQVNWLDQDLQLMSYQLPHRARVEAKVPAHIDQIKQLAHIIGKQFNFVRVDFLMDDDENFYLGELTFTPGNAHTRRPESLDRKLGEMWKTLS